MTRNATATVTTATVTDQAPTKAARTRSAKAATVPATVPATATPTQEPNMTATIATPATVTVQADQAVTPDTTWADRLVSITTAIPELSATEAAAEVASFYMTAPASDLNAIRAYVKTRLDAAMTTGDLAGAQAWHGITLTRAAKAAAPVTRDLSDYARVIASRTWGAFLAATESDTTPADLPTDADRAELERLVTGLYRAARDGDVTGLDAAIVSATTESVSEVITARAFRKSGKAATTGGSGVRESVGPRIAENLLNVVPVGTWITLSKVAAMNGLGDDVRLSPVTYGNSTGAGFGGRVMAHVIGWAKTGTPDGVEVRESVAGVHHAGVRLNDRAAYAAWVADRFALDATGDAYQA
jgi:hypothetical protein